MAIFRYKNSKNWWISIYLPGGKRKYFSTGTDDRSKALTIEALAKTSMQGNLSRDNLIGAIDSLMGWQARKGIQIGDLWDTYLKTRPTVGPHTMRQRKTWCDEFTDWMADNHPAIKELQEITPQHAFEFSDWVYEQKGGTGKTHNNRIGNLKTVFKAVMIRAGLERNPFGLHGKISEDDSLHGRAFTADEQDEIFKRCVEAGNDWLAICTLAKYSGARLKDIALLEWKQVGKDSIDITPAKTRRHGIRAMIPIHPKVAKELNLLNRNGKYVFPALAARYADSDRSDSGFMREVLNHCKVDKSGAHITFHCWRHTFRTMMARARVPQEVAMKIAGWTNQDTAEMYNHDFTQMQDAINSLD